MACMNEHHKKVDDTGKGKCSVPLWCSAGCPAGFCDEDAFGPQTKEYLESFKYVDARIFKPAYAPGLACPKHGGPKESVKKSDIITQEELDELSKQ